MLKTRFLINVLKSRLPKEKLLIDICPKIFLNVWNEPNSLPSLLASHSFFCGTNEMCEWTRKFLVFPWIKSHYIYNIKRQIIIEIYYATKTVSQGLVISGGQQMAGTPWLGWIYRVNWLKSRPKYHVIQYNLSLII